MFILIIISWRLLYEGALNFISRVLRRLMINICSHAVDQNSGELAFQTLATGLAAVFPGILY
jgi:hypothetical protein